MGEPIPGRRTVNDALGALEFSRSLDDAAIVTDAVILLRVTRVDGDTTLLYDRTRGTDDVVMYGLLTAAKAVLDGQWRAASDYEG